MRNIFHDLALLFAGALASVIGGLLLKPPFWDHNIWILVSVTIILILYGSLSFQYFFSFYRKQIKKLFPEIGVLNDMDWPNNGEDVSSWTHVSPQAWREALEKIRPKKKFKIKLVKSNVNFDRFNCILNPYGAVYPEIDSKNFKILEKIMNYVNEGGFFINVSDIPGYFAYLPSLNRRIDVTPQIWAMGIHNGQPVVNAVRPFQLTPFMERLGLQILSTDTFPLTLEIDVQLSTLKGKASSLKVNRVAIEEKNIKPLITSTLPDGKKISPLFHVNYGRGRFLFSLIFLRANQELNLQDVISELIFKELGKKK